MNMGSFFTVVALSLAILAVDAANVTVHAQGPAGYYNKSTEKTWQGGRDTTDSYKDAALNDRQKTDARNQDFNERTGANRSAQSQQGKSGTKAASVTSEKNIGDHAQTTPGGQ